MEAAIIARAAKVRQSGQYLGFLEWATWGHLHNMRVSMLFGTTKQEVLELFAPSVGAANPDQPWGVARVAAVRSTGVVGKWLAASGDNPIVNHFVIGVASKLSASGDDPAVVGHAKASCARRSALRAGWQLKATSADGNCGPDAMAYHLGLPRRLYTWNRFRSEIADFLVAHAGDSKWQDVAKSCQEGELVPGAGCAGVGGLGPCPIPVLEVAACATFPEPSEAEPPKPDTSAALCASSPSQVLDALLAATSQEASGVEPYSSAAASSGGPSSWGGLNADQRLDLGHAGALPLTQEALLAGDVSNCEPEVSQKQHGRGKTVNHWL